MIKNKLYMLTNEEAKKIIKDTVKKSIIDFAQRSLNKEAKFQILDLIIPKERKIRSIVGGLETSLGTTLWEPLALRNGFEVINDNLQSPVNMPANLSNTLQNILDERKRNSGVYDAVSSHDEIKRVCQSFINRPIDSFESAPKGFGVDIWLKKGGVNYFFDTKTVQPNIGNYSKFVDQILNWYAFFYSRFPDQMAESRIVFPYNPHNEVFWSKTMGKGKPLEADNEGWVENQFWNFCTGLEDTYGLIVESFTELRQSKELEVDLNKILN
ncbi:TdeIII family type II restriction endonuclease [Tenacibaculum finnmarkense]|uniref:TdeIII family type II restriction endonuclease n=1 Tax=Tenacibaculum finnmarkense TaxID=2781243 RepID=UPI0011AEC4DA|nr:TdeIII family type II restriction endonuclease [Tenacibaculum finnmarkense]MCD8438548.1 TdeIII family type II restriction endonuclease [Tenacibaculum finnmarkense genomovar ulcerans]MCG8719480.1 TdeIII family type II restriction endonuclease [Tenacibaculum finnmarkense]